MQFDSETRESSLYEDDKRVNTHVCQSHVAWMSFVEITTCFIYLCLLWAIVYSSCISCVYLWQKSHNLTLPAWSTNGTTWAALRNLTYFNMRWLFNSPEIAKLTGGSFTFHVLKIWILFCHYMHLNQQCPPLCRIHWASL